jgi:hypothetical protein
MGKEQFLMFRKVLMKYLKQKDQSMHAPKKSSETVPRKTRKGIQPIPASVSACNHTSNNSWEA